MNTIRNIYFRSSLSSCNYQCPYCSFGKKTDTTDYVRDKAVINRFYDKITRLNNPLQIMLIPYGEVMIHDYYRIFILQLSKLPHIYGISCQTNLSFSTGLFIKSIRENNADTEKIKLWASYHPEMVSVDVFIRKVHCLYNYGIELCVGAVGNYANKRVIGELRQKLDNRIYLFVNEIQRKNNKLDEEDIAYYNRIDPLFSYDHKNAKADINNCRGGKETIFINEEGDIYPCPRNPLKTGNIYFDAEEENVVTPVCKKKRCDCYIAYSNLRNSSLQTMMGEGVLWRIPEKNKVKAIFFDIDGTLTDNRGEIPASYYSALDELSRQGIILYLATALPVIDARRRLGGLFHIFKGGVFADGAHLRYNETDVYYPLTSVLEIDNSACKIHRYADSGAVYKYALSFSSVKKAKQVEQALDKTQYRVTTEGRLLTIVDIHASKLNGVITLCQQTGIPLKEVAAIGNTMHDWPMLSATGYSCAVLDADTELQSLVKYIINPDHLPVFFTSL